MARFFDHIEAGLHSEDGFSTVGVALALLITLALIFSAAQVYEINSVSADIQEVADAAALAAENVVGEYCVVATVCDAIALSLSLSSLCCLGLGVAAACTPVTAAASETLFKAAHKLKDMRDTFISKATAGLEKLKKLLPLAAAAKAAQVISANSSTRANASYAGVAILVPWKTDELQVDSHDKADEAFQSADEKKDEIKALGEDAEKAAHDANLLKEEAYQHDSGSESAYCMYERAKNLAGMTGGENPFYSSSETWDFDVALERAKIYYPKRAAIETPDGTSTEAKARSALRKRYYQYASSEVAKGFVVQTQDAFDAYFPKLPKNTDEMRQTTLYTQSCYPISSSSSGKSVMHAFEGCPEYTSSGKTGYGSIAQMDNNPAFETCPKCGFAASSMGSVGAASSSIDNGFEYHYRIVADLADAYTEARRSLDGRSRELKESAQGLFDSIKEALAEAKAQRIKLDPPGKFGAIAFVITTNPGNIGFASNFVTGPSTLSTRAAISGATLVPESSDSDATIINSLLDGFADNGGFSPVGAGKIVLDLWSKLLTGYGEGQNALMSGIKEALGALPLASESGLANWAGERLAATLEDLGLEPAELAPNKAALINTAHILRADSSGFSVRLLQVKENVLSFQTADELFSSALADAESTVTSAIDSAEFTINIATIQILENSIEIPITITLPQSIKDSATSLVHQSFDALGNAISQIIPARRWE